MCESSKGRIQSRFLFDHKNALILKRLPSLKWFQGRERRDVDDEATARSRKSSQEGRVESHQRKLEKRSRFVALRRYVIFGLQQLESFIKRIYN